MDDREKVIRGLECHQEPYGCPKCPYWDREMPLKDCENNKLIADALALLREQKPVEPTWWRGLAFCGKCGRKFGRGFKYCPDCGKAVKWGD